MAANVTRLSTLAAQQSKLLAVNTHTCTPITMSALRRRTVIALPAAQNRDCEICQTAHRTSRKPACLGCPLLFQYISSDIRSIVMCSRAGCAAGSDWCAAPCACEHLPEPTDTTRARSVHCGPIMMVCCSCRCTSVCSARERLCAAHDLHDASACTPESSSATRRRASYRVRLDVSHRSVFCCKGMAV